VGGWEIEGDSSRIVSSGKVEGGGLEEAGFPENG